MNRRLRIAMFVGSFPLISETFILRQITGLIDLGHEVDIIAENKPDADMPVHPEVRKYGLLARTKYVNGPPESTYWEMPVYPLTGKTWIPGAEKSLSNISRALRAAPTLIHCLIRSPKLTASVLDRGLYGYQAASLSALYRLSSLCSQPGRYDVVHAHFGPVGNNFRFVRAHWKVPLIVSFHGYDLCTVPRTEGNDVYNRLFSMVDVVTA